MNSSPTPRVRRFSRSVRRAVNSGHVVFAVGLLGAEWAMLLTSVVARSTDDPTLRHSGYRLMQVFALGGGIPFSVLSLISGVLLCLYTPWGLWKHLWIKVKIVLLLAVIVTGVGVVSQFVHRLMSASAPGGDADALPALQTWHLAAVIFQILALIVATALSVFKPAGKGARRSRTPVKPRTRDAEASSDRTGTPRRQPESADSR
ncbi:DUF2269 family protein [Streptomyces sp. SID3343]|uniref:DUF2269 family protein n=1 Tax=Streptomyces sp. SID3343 TaxID=2690260 RepID=UPI00136F1BA3|nr:DUF2269 family protein [Streptomyces sp. SID3343]MYV99201.1 hypothetical protein [Streptomyces sp. SID3343]